MQQAARPLARKTNERVKIFLSFYHEDLSLATRVCKFIEQKMGEVVFFSKQDRNPLFFKAIFKALDTAKCLVAVATKPDHLERNWPSYEWTNFLVRKLEEDEEGDKKDKKDLSIIPFIQGFTPGDLLSQFREFRAVQVEPQGLQAALKELGEILDLCCR